MSATCFVCHRGDWAVGALCLDCAGRLEPHGEGRVLSLASPGEQAWLVDRRGQLHPIESLARVGRKGPEIIVADGLASRSHATIVRHGERWRLIDHATRNGTFVNLARVEESPLAHGDLLLFARTPVIFALGAPSGTLLQNSALTASTGSASDSGARFEVYAPARQVVSVVPRTDGEGGLIVVTPEQRVVTHLQLALLVQLLARLRDDADKPQPIRGHVATAELLADLPWTTPYPTLNQMKQLARRTRDRLEGLPMALESQHGLGYRLWFPSVA